ncbi:MAG: DegV family protein [Clostridia bacterium]|nr:DegV family protein [Clostridia bacterium]
MVKIISDSTCDLSPELIAKYDIDILPLHIVLGEEDFEDGRGISPDEIYQWSDLHRQSPKTAACTLPDAMAALEPYVSAGREVIMFSISSSMSSTFNVMNMAAEQLDAGHLVTVIDSMNLSTGVGLQVIEAAEMAQQGKSAREIITHIEAIRPRVRASFVVDTLTYLHRGGRCSGLVAMMGGALRLHPRIGVADGKMAPGKKYRGKMDRVILSYAQEMEAELRTAKPDRVFITHSGCPESTITAVQEWLQSLGCFNEIHITRAGGVVSSHCGPGTLGVLFIAGE